MIDINCVKVLKKDGLKVPFNIEKVYIAIGKSAERAMVELTDEDRSKIGEYITNYIQTNDMSEVTVLMMHHLVENALASLGYDDVVKSYKEYRDYKTTFAVMMDEVYKKARMIMYRGDGHSNANTDETLVTTQRCLIAGELNRILYKMFDLNADERLACKEGYIYVHDQSARRDTYNCCLFDTAAVMKGGFNMGSQHYNEPKTIDTAMDVLGDIILMSASQQYGGWSTRIDDLLAPYVEKSYQAYVDKYLNIIDELKVPVNEPDRATWAANKALADLETDLRQGFQGLEMKLNTVASSRGDYPFVSFALGLGAKWSEVLVSKWCLKVRMAGQGEEGKKKPVVFPKLIFLYDEELHGKGKVLEDLFELALDCSSKAMYPDYLSLSGEGYVPEMYKKYGAVIYPMGCRAFLSPWYERGGMTPADDADKPVYTGRFNLGAISLNLIMIYQKAKEEGKDFYEVLDYYLQMIRRIHIRTFDYLSKKKASMSPLAFCEGGLYGGHLQPDECIGKVLRPCTMSFGITGLNELNILHNGKTICEDGEFPLEVMEHINKKKEEWKVEDNILYAIYGTPAESLSGLQVKQFRNKYGVIPGVSDKDYLSNSFHCHVSEDINGIQKQDSEKRFWDLFAGGRIQYVRYNLDYNKEAMRTLVRRAMKMGFYEGVNLCLSYCEDCGHEELGMEVCPKCGSHNITQIDRVIGYLGYTRIHGDTRMNESKRAEIADRKSM